MVNVDVEIAKIEGRLNGFETQLSGITNRLGEAKVENKEAFRELKELLQQSNLSTNRLREDINILFNSNIVRDGKIESNAKAIEGLIATTKALQAAQAADDRTITSSKAVLGSWSGVLKWIGFGTILALIGSLIR